LACSATRPVCQENSKHLTNVSASQVFPARTSSKDSAAATDLLQQHEKSQAPDMKEVDEAAESLKTQLQDDGVLHTSMKEANTEAGELLAAAEEFSKLTKGIEQATQKVTDTAAETSKKMEEVHDQVKTNSEAGVETISTKISEKAKADQEAHKTHVESKKKESSSFLSTGVSIARHDGSSNKTQAPGDGEAQIEELMGKLHQTYGQLEELISVSHEKAQVAKDSAEKWATEPVKKYQDGAEFAQFKAKMVASEMNKGNKALKEEVEGHVNEVLAKHHESKTEDIDEVTVTKKPEKDLVQETVTQQPDDGSL